jgi:hypothetical protein
VIGDQYYAIDENPQSGIIQLYANDLLLATAFSAEGMSRLGEYVWVGSDYLPSPDAESQDLNGSIVIVASSYASESTRYINLYREFRF